MHNSHKEKGKRRKQTERIQWNLRIMKVNFFHYLEVFLIERFKCIEVYANGTLELWEVFHYWGSSLLEVSLYKLTQSATGSV